MFATILSLFGGGSLGAILRFIPEILKIVNSKSDQAHEFKMTELQLKIDAGRASQALDLVHAQGEASALSGQIQAFADAVKGQGQLTGVRWIDGLNASVRPMFTYWLMALYTAYKVTVISDAWQNFTTLKDFGTQVWTPNDMVLFSSVATFWFVDRMYFHKDQK